MIWSTFIITGYVGMHCFFYSECTSVFDQTAFISYNCKALLELKIGAERWCGMGLAKNKRKETPGFVVLNCEHDKHSHCISR